VSDLPTGDGGGEERREDVPSFASDEVPNSELDEIVERLPAADQERIRAVVAQSTYSGPIPPPAHLQRYEEILPGAAERIFAMTEKEQTQRHTWDNRALEGELSYRRLGLVLGVLALLLIVGGVVFLGHEGRTAAGVALAGVGAAGIVGAFINGRSNGKDRD
jgi:uncharacterized membrane protein